MAVARHRACGLARMIRSNTSAVRGVSSGSPWIRSLEPSSHAMIDTATTSSVNPWTRKSTQTAFAGVCGLCHWSEVPAQNLSASDWQKFSMAPASSRALRRERPLWSARRPLESNVPCSNFEELVPPDENLEVLDAEPMHSGLGWSTPLARILEMEPFSDSATPSPTLAHLGVDSDLDLSSTNV